MECTARHPTQNVRCWLKTAGDHPEHTGFVDDDPSQEQLFWNNDAYAPSGSNGEVRLAHLAAKLKPVVRHDDPWTSHVAAHRIEPKRGTRKAAVLTLLRDANGDWVDGVLLTRPDVGGSEGLRRLRELASDDGWFIDRRPDPGSDTAWQYRLGTNPV